MEVHMLARRSIQALLDEAAAYLDPRHIDRLVAHLNRSNRGSIEAEWELIILAALASIGTVQHEPDLGGTARLDVRFCSTSLRFISDVRVVSDETCHRENPVARLENELFRHSMKLREEGIEGGFTFTVSGIRPCPKEGRHRTTLVLPREHEFARFIFDKRSHSFLEGIRREPFEVHHHLVDSAHAAVSIAFTPSSGGLPSFSGYPVFNLPHDVAHNVVYQALRDKSRQLKRAGPRDSGELAGVILCDGGCAMLRALAGIWTVPLDRVIRSFLRKSRTVDFACVVDVHAASSWPPQPLRFEARAWSLRYPDLIEDFQTGLSTALQTMPTPVRSAVNTSNHFKWAAGSLHRLYSDYKRDTWMKANSIEISLRATMDYLAGRIDRAEYERVVPPDWLTHLQRKLDEGICISDVSIVRHPGEDDDGLVLVFGDKDPAMSVFRRTQ